MNDTLESSAVQDDPDLSQEIARKVQKRPGDMVRVKRVSPTTYRCNWLELDDGEAAGGSRFLQTYRIRESRFLRVNRKEGELVIEDITADSARRN